MKIWRLYTYNENENDCQKSLCVYTYRYAQSYKKAFIKEIINKINNITNFFIFDSSRKRDQTVSQPFSFNTKE